MTKVLLSFIAAAFASRDMEAEFEAWSEQHGIAFKDQEEQDYRFSIWLASDEKIQTHNAKNLSYTLGHNKFSHMTLDEFHKDRKLGNYSRGLPMTKNKNLLGASNPVHVIKEGEALSSSVDWSQAGAVTNVKDQGQCGSCWSFSTTGALEGAYYIANSELLSFSEQQLVSCDTTDSGCNGGLMDYAFEWVKNNGGLCTEADYPYSTSTYEGSSGTCETTCSLVSGVAPTSYIDVGHSDEDMMSALSQQPVSIAIEADQEGFQLYSSGVYTGTCGNNLDHGVLAVGYGTSDDGIDYYKVKNSWAESWGDAGYILIERGADLCGVYDSASYPVL